MRGMRKRRQAARRAPHRAVQNLTKQLQATWLNRTSDAAAPHAHQCAPGSPHGGRVRRRHAERVQLKDRPRRCGARQLPVSSAPRLHAAASLRCAGRGSVGVRVAGWSRNRPAYAENYLVRSPSTLQAHLRTTGNRTPECEDSGAREGKGRPAGKAGAAGTAAAAAGGRRAAHGVLGAEGRALLLCDVLRSWRGLMLWASQARQRPAINGAAVAWPPTRAGRVERFVCAEAASCAARLPSTACS